jgi:hypothetical protein
MGERRSLDQCGYDIGRELAGPGNGLDDQAQGAAGVALQGISAAAFAPKQQEMNKLDIRRGGKALKAHITARRRLVEATIVSVSHAFRLR